MEPAAVPVDAAASPGRPDGPDRRRACWCRCSATRWLMASVCDGTARLAGRSSQVAMQEASGAFSSRRLHRSCGGSGTVRAATLTEMSGTVSNRSSSAHSSRCSNDAVRPRSRSSLDDIIDLVSYASVGQAASVSGYCDNTGGELRGGNLRLTRSRLQPGHLESRANGEAGSSDVELGPIQEMATLDAKRRLDKIAGVMRSSRTAPTGGYCENPHEGVAWQVRISYSRQEARV